MKENQNTPAKESFSFVGTQYLAWGLSMLMVVTSISPAWAGGGKGKNFQLTVRAMTDKSLSVELNNKLARKVQVATMGKTPLRLTINGQDFTLTPTQTTALPKNNAAGEHILQVPSDLAKGSSTSLQAQPSAEANIDLKDLFTRIEYARQLIEAEAPEDAVAILKPMVQQTKKMVKELHSTRKEFSTFLANMEIFLDEAEQTLSKKEPTQEELQALYWEGLRAYDDLFSSTHIVTDHKKLAEVLQLLEERTKQLDRASLKLKYEKQEKKLLWVGVIGSLIGFLIIIVLLYFAAEYDE